MPSIPVPKTVATKTEAIRYLDALAKDAAEVVKGLAQDYIKAAPPTGDPKTWLSDLIKQVSTQAQTRLTDFTTRLRLWRQQFGDDVSPYTNLQSLILPVLQNLSEEIASKKPQPAQETSETKTTVPKAESVNTKTYETVVYELARTLLSFYSYYYTELVSRSLLQLLLPYKDSFLKTLAEATWGHIQPAVAETPQNNFGWEKMPEFLVSVLGPKSEFVSKPGTLQDKARVLARSSGVADSPEFVQAYGPKSFSLALQHIIPKLQHAVLTLEGLDLNALFLSILAALAGASYEISPADLVAQATKNLKDHQNDPNFKQMLEIEIKKLQDAYKNSLPSVPVPPVTQLLFKVMYEHYIGTSTSEASALGLQSYLVETQFIQRLGRHHGQNERQRVQAFPEGGSSYP